VVAETGTKKSPALKLAAWPFYERQRRLFQPSIHAQGLEAQACADALDSPHRPLLPADAAPKPVMAPLPARDMAPPPQLFTTDATLEALIVLLAQNPRGVALIQDELTGWARAMDQYRRKGADRQRWLSFWNGAPVIVNRKSRQQPIVLENPLVCVAGCLPPDVLGELSDERGREDGFMHRLLCSYPDPMPVHWTEAAISEQTLQGYAAVYEGLWDLQGDLGQAGAGPPPPIELSFDAQGRVAFVQFASALYEELANSHLPDYLRGPYAKLDGYGARLALILHLCRVVADKADAEAVDAHSVKAAIALIEYFKAHARRVYGRLRSTRADQRAETALRWIQAHEGTCTVRDLQRHRVAGIRRASEAERLLRDLVDLGHGALHERTLLSGRRQRVFVRHPTNAW
jgi:hypothetical protein